MKDAKNRLLARPAILQCPPMKTIRNALIIGGGIAGMSTAIELRKRGVTVDLVEQDDESAEESYGRYWRAS
jgi:2-polyprenyl-6-methoxyphenol hydroxylase-like FAD-dependent oxidoreductase